jgi:hypothetical protein
MKISAFFVSPPGFSTCTAGIRKHSIAKGLGMVVDSVMSSVSNPSHSKASELIPA